MPEFEFMKIIFSIFQAKGQNNPKTVFRVILRVILTQLTVVPDPANPDSAPIHGSWRKIDIYSNLSYITSILANILFEE